VKKQQYLLECNTIYSLVEVSALLATRFFDPEDRGRMFLRNVAELAMDYTALYPRRQHSL
jgi:hypothetical protein